MVDRIKHNQLRERFEALRGWRARVFGLATPQMIKCDRCSTDTTAWTELGWTEWCWLPRRGTVYADSGWHNRVCVPCHKVIGLDVERAIASAISDSLLWDAADDLQGQELAEWLEEYGPDSGAQPR